MTRKLPRVDAKKVGRVLSKLGFRLVRHSGSHRILRNSEGKRVTLPYHSKKILHPKLLRSILKDAGISVEEFRRLLR